MGLNSFWFAITETLILSCQFMVSRRLGWTIGDILYVDIVRNALWFLFSIFRNLQIILYIMDNFFYSIKNVVLLK
jgi:hypothetical protein